jgi:molecular chaperone GrpE
MTESHTESQPEEHTEAHIESGTDWTEERAPADTNADEDAARAEAETMVAEMRDRWQRAQAEIDNTRKRYERQLADRATTERARVAAEWLPVLDNLERALSHADADPRAILAGIRAVREQALTILHRLGITRIDDTGTTFDPSRHQAAQAVDAPDTEPGTVLAVLQPGYAADDGLLRPAIVTVAGNPTGEQAREPARKPARERTEERTGEQG